MKIKFCLLSLISILLIEVAYSQQLGWTFNDIVKLKGNNFERSNIDANVYNISYEKKIMENGKEFIDFTEIYYFNSSTNKVYRYMSIGNKSESEIVEIIEKGGLQSKGIFLALRVNSPQPDLYL